MNRPLISVAAALALLGGLLVAQHYLERTPDASLSALPTATAEPVAIERGTTSPYSVPAQADSGLESSMASDAMSAAGAR